MNISLFDAQFQRNFDAIVLYVAYEQEIYSLLTLQFHKFKKRSL